LVGDGRTATNTIFPGFLLSWFSAPASPPLPSGFAVHLVHPILSIPD